MKKTYQGNVLTFDRSTAYWHRRAGDHRRKGHYTRAAVLLRQAAEDKNNASALLELGEMMNQMACWESACTLLSSLTARYPLYGSAYYQLAESLYRLGRKSEAADAYDCALRTAQDDSYYDDAVRRLNLLEDEMNESSRTLFFRKKAFQAFSRDDYEEMERLYLRALRSSLHKAEVLTSLAVCMGQAGMMDKAIQYAARAVKEDPKSFRAHCAVASTLLFMDKPRAAKGLLNDAVQFMDTASDENTFCQVAGIMEQNRMIYQVLTQRLKSYPNRLPIMYNLAVASMRLGYTQQGFELLEHADSLDPDAPWMMAVYQALNHWGDDEITNQPLFYYPLLTKNMYRRQLFGFVNELEIKGSLEPTPALYARISALLSLEEPSFQNLLLLLFDAIKPECLEDFSRQMLMLPGVEAKVQLRALETLVNMHAKPPFLVQTNKRLMLVEAPLSTKGKAPLFDAFVHTLLGFGRGEFTPNELIQEGARVWHFLSPFFRKEAVGEWSGAWCTGVMMHLHEQKKDYKKSAQLLFDCGFSQRKVETIAAVLEALDPHQEVLKNDSEAD